MDSVAIGVTGLSKQYRIGSRAAPYRTLRESLSGLGAKLARRLSRGERDDCQERWLWALKDVTLQVRRGEVLGLIGRNGAGKTTLLKVLSRITPPTEGRAEISGRVGSLLEVGTGFHPELTGRENIYLSGAILGMWRGEINRKFDEIVSFSEIEPFIDTPVKHYSSGMYVRLAFAVAAHLELDILLVDEVLAVGDLQFQRKCLGKMQDIGRAGRTILLVSHNLSAIRALCSRAIWLEGGRVASDGPADDVCQEYMTWGEDVVGESDLTAPRLRTCWVPESCFRWTRLTILSSTGKVTSYLEEGEPFELLLQGVASAPLEEMVFSLAIWGGGGSGYLCDSMQTDSGVPTAFPAGPIVFRVRFDLNLFAHGLFSIDINAKGRRVHDPIAGASRFFIRRSPAGGRETAGVFRYPCTWSLEPEAGPRSIRQGAFVSTP